MKNTLLVIKHLLYIPLLVASLFIGGCDLLSGERHSDFDESARDEESEEITICSPIPETEIESVILSEKEKRFVVKGNKFAFDMIDTLSIKRSLRSRHGRKWSQRGCKGGDNGGYRGKCQ